MLTYAENIQNGFILMLAGMGGVFVVLVLFYFIIKLLQYLFPDDENPFYLRILRKSRGTQ